MQNNKMEIQHTVNKFTNAKPFETFQGRTNEIFKNSFLPYSLSRLSL